MSVGLPLMKNVLTPLAKSVLVPLGSTAAAWAADAAIQKKTYGLGTTTLVFSNEDLNNVIKILKSLEESSLLIKGVSETVENDVKEQKGGSHVILAATLAASFLGSALMGRGEVRGGDGVIWTIRAGEGQYF